MQILRISSSESLGQLFCKTTQSWQFAPFRNMWLGFTGASIILADRTRRLYCVQNARKQQCPQRNEQRPDRHVKKHQFLRAIGRFMADLNLMDTFSNNQWLMVLFQFFLRCACCCKNNALCEKTGACHTHSNVYSFGFDDNNGEIKVKKLAFEWVLPTTWFNWAKVRELYMSNLIKGYALSSIHSPDHNTNSKLIIKQWIPMEIYKT